MGDRILVAFFPHPVDVAPAVAQLARLGEEALAIEVTSLSSHGLLEARPTSAAAPGAVVGALAGGLAGGLAGLFGAAGSVLIPGLDAVIAGPLVTAAAGAGLGGVLGLALGAIAGALITVYGVVVREERSPPSEALLAVRCEARFTRPVKELLRAAGARRFSRTFSAADWSSPAIAARRAS